MDINVIMLNNTKFYDDCQKNLYLVIKAYST